MNRYKLSIELVTCSIIILASWLGVQAQLASVAITPASVDSTVKPGAAYTQDFTITNGTKAPIRYRFSVSDVWFDEKNNRLSGRAGTLPRSASLWIRFTPSEVIVEPNSAATVKAIITVPNGASGSYYAVPVFDGSPVEKLVTPVADQGITASAMIGIQFNGLMMFTTSTGAEYNIEIMDGKIVPPTSSAEMEINLHLRNRGSAHAGVRGAFAILDSSGALIGRGNTEEKRLLPTQHKTIKGNWSEELPPGSYSCIVTLSYNRVGLEPVSLIYELPFVVK